MGVDSFFGYNVAISGLNSAQRSLNIVNHNLSNANTEGYSRQKVVQTANGAMGIYNGTGMLGTGSNVTGVERVREEYLDLKYWSEETTAGEWDKKKELLGEIEAVFNEPSDSGFNTTINDFFDSMQELGKDPSSDAVRAVVREKGVTLTKYFNSTAEHFEKVQSDINGMIRVKVQEVNSLAKQIRDVNVQVRSLELDGSKANDLRDQRALLVDRLSKLVNIEASEYATGRYSGGSAELKFSVSISGKTLVDDKDVSEISLELREENLNDEDVDGLYGVSWADGNSLQIRGGELKGLFDVRDGNDGEGESPYFKGVPFYQRKLNEFVRTFAMAINEGYLDVNNNGIIESNEDGIGHADGYKKNSIEGDKSSGIRFFTMLDADEKNIDSSEFLNGADSVSDNTFTPLNEKVDSVVGRYQNLTAKNFAVSKDIFSSFDNISISGKAGKNGNIDTLTKILDVRHNSELFSEGAPEDFMKSLVSTLGIDTQQAIRISENQQSVVEQVKNRRMSDSGVSLDEEMANLVKFQHTYNASAKMISTMTEIYETLINKLGI